MRSFPVAPAPVLLPLLLLTLSVTACVRSLARQTTLGALDALEASEAEDARARAAGATASGGPSSPAGEAAGEVGEAGESGDVGDVGEAGGGGPVAEVGESLAGSVADEVVDVVVFRRAELGELSGTLAETSTRAALEQVGAELDRALRTELASPGVHSQAVTAAAAAATRGALDASLVELRVALADACPGAGNLRECLHGEVRAVSGQVVAGALDELRWPLRVLVGALVLLTLASGVVLALVLVRLLGAPRGGSRGGAPAQTLTSRGT